MPGKGSHRPAHQSHPHRPDLLLHHHPGPPAQPQPGRPHLTHHRPPHHPRRQPHTPHRQTPPPHPCYNAHSNYVVGDATRDTVTLAIVATFASIAKPKPLIAIAKASPHFAAFTDGLVY